MGYCHRSTDQDTPRWKTALPGAGWVVIIADSADYCTAALADGTIRWYRLSDGEEVLFLYVHPDLKRWVIWTPSGYYDASPGGEDLIGWHVNRGADNAPDFFSASRFSGKYYRPDIVQAMLSYGDERLAIAAADSICWCAERKARDQRTAAACCLHSHTGVR